MSKGAPRASCKWLRAISEGFKGMVGLRLVSVLPKIKTIKVPQLQWDVAREASNCLWSCPSDSVRFARRGAYTDQLINGSSGTALFGCDWDEHLFYHTTLMITQSKLVPNSPRCSGGILAGLPVIVVVRKRIGMLKFTIVATVDDDSSIVSISRRVRWMLIPTVDQLTVFPLVIRWYSTVFCLWWGTIISAQCSLIE